MKGTVSWSDDLLRNFNLFSRDCDSQLAAISDKLFEVLERVADKA